MSEIMEPKIEEQPGEALSWSKVWISVFTRPSTKTFEWILRDPGASPRRAYLWIFISALIGAIITSVYSMLGFTPGLGESAPSFIPLLCAPVIAVVSILGVAFSVWVIQWIAGRFFGGSGSYASLIYAIAAIVAPTTIITSLIGGIPYVNCLLLPLVIYGYVLAVMAVKAVNQFGWGQAVISYFAPTVVVIGVVAVITLCVLITLGPAISNAFQNVIQNPGVPVP